jgi:ribonuclease HI
MANTYTCKTCGEDFTVPQAALDKFPGWVPRVCLKCRNRTPGAKKSAKKKKTSRPRTRTAELNLPLAEVRQRFSGGPQSGMFTDGSAQPNPGPGGWGVVHVVDGEVVDQRHGHEPQTTNNRMELMALIEGFQMVPADAELDVFTDSQLCVNIVTKWAAGWKRNGWRRKSGPIKNLELVQKLYALHLDRPGLRLQWIQAHDGSLWNEYADALATAWARDEL